MQELANQAAIVADDFRRQLAQVQLFYQFLTKEIREPKKDTPYMMHRKSA